MPTGQQLLCRGYCFLAMGENDFARRDLMQAFSIDGADPEIQFALLGVTASDDVARALLANPLAGTAQIRRALAHVPAASPIVPTANGSRSGISGRVGWREDEASALNVSPSPVQSKATGRTMLDLVSVVVPVFAGASATRTCLAALMTACCEAAVEVIVVDDACPDPALSREVEATCTQQGWRYIRNASNLGFAASVNRGVATACGQYVLLLNADAVLPRDAVPRLLAAIDQPDVGTVVPLSNDGGFTSFPRLRERNRVPTPQEAEHVDDAARAVGRGILDIPSGTAFCMLVTRACWDTVGGLDLGYGRGYFEDVDFCLRAKRLGYRNVLASNIFVRHIGGQSFGPSKRALVAGNAHLLRERFPGYDAAWMAFVERDPLRPLRGAIERRMPARGPIHLLVGRERRLAPVLPTRAEQVAADGGRVLKLSWLRDGAVALQACDGEMPQSLHFAPSETTDLVAYLRNLDLRAVEIAEPDAIPSRLLETLLALHAPLALLLADRRATCFVAEASSGWTKGRRVIALDGMVRAALGSQDTCGDQDFDPSVRARGRRSVDRNPHLRRNTRPQGPLPSVLPMSTPVQGEPPCIAALAPVACLATDRLVDALDRLLRPFGGNALIFGTGWGGAGHRTTGAMASCEYPAALRHRAVTHVLLADPDAAFGLIEELRPEVPLPAAFIDWSRGRYDVRPGDLALPEELGIEAAAAAIRDWCAPVAEHHAA